MEKIEYAFWKCKIHNDETLKETKYQATWHAMGVYI